MKIIAKQIAPEYQDTRFYRDEFENCYPGLYLYGNRNYHGITTPVFLELVNRFDSWDKIARALSIIHREKYSCVCFRGSSQSEWQYCFYPMHGFTPAALRMIEKEYFNTCTEWVINDDFSMYCYGDTWEEIRQEIADATGTTPENVILSVFEGRIRTAKYKVV